MPCKALLKAFETFFTWHLKGPLKAFLQAVERPFKGNQSFYRLFKGLWHFKGLLKASKAPGNCFLQAFGQYVKGLVSDFCRLPKCLVKVF